MFQVIHERLQFGENSITKYRQAIGPLFTCEAAASNFASVLQAIVIQERANIGQCALCNSAENVFTSDIDCLSDFMKDCKCSKYVPMVDPETVLFDGESAHRVRCANGVVDDDMHDTFIVEECKY